MTAEYMVGRATQDLDPAVASYVDALFPAARSEQATFNNVTFTHCTFANVSLKGTTLTGCTFQNVAFVGVYFRDTVLSNCRFEGCRFIDCDMTRVDIRACNLAYYNKFSNTYLPYDRVRESLPSEGNLRQYLCDNLGRESTAVGEYSDTGKYRAASMEGQLDFLKAVIRRNSPFYRRKYDVADSVRAALRFTRLKVFNAIWGNTRSHWVVLRNWVLLALVAAICFASLGHSSVGEKSTWLRAGVYGALATIPINPPTEYTLHSAALSWLIVLFRVLGLMFAAIFAALLFARAYEGRR